MRNKYERFVDDFLAWANKEEHIEQWPKYCAWYLRILGWNTTAINDFIDATLITT
jgi:hypothetical protein